MFQTFEQCGWCHPPSSPISSSITISIKIYVIVVMNKQVISRICIKIVFILVVVGSSCWEEWRQLETCSLSRLEQRYVTQKKAKHCKMMMNIISLSLSLSSISTLNKLLSNCHSLWGLPQNIVTACWFPRIFSRIKSEEDIWVSLGWLDGLEF